MASGFFALLDDISVLMDDVATMSKVATKKTAGILGDDLAVNAEKASGFVSSRELPVLWAITKGSFINKLIILPFAFLLSAFSPMAITLILVLGGLYLAFEGAEKILEYFFPHAHETKKVETDEVLSEETILAKEKEKIKSAIVTDFILSVEIVIIALGAVVKESLTIQILSVTFVAILATIGVYGIVALIVRMDDMGFRLMKSSNNDNSFQNKIGAMLVKALPLVIKSLAVIGTIALLTVAGGIFAHNIPIFHHLLPQIPSIIAELVLGFLIGAITVGVVTLVKKLIGKK